MSTLGRYHEYIGGCSVHMGDTMQFLVNYTLNEVIFNRIDQR